MIDDATAALRGWAREDTEGRVMTVVEDPSIIDYIPVVLAQRDELARALARLIAAVDPWGLDMENTPFAAHTEFSAAVFAAQEVLAKEAA